MVDTTSKNKTTTSPFLHRNRSIILEILMKSNLIFNTITVFSHFPVPSWDSNCPATHETRPQETQQHVIQRYRVGALVEVLAVKVFESRSS